MIRAPLFPRPKTRVEPAQSEAERQLRNATFAELARVVEKIDLPTVAAAVTAFLRAIEHATPGAVPTTTRPAAIRVRPAPKADLPVGV
jgi:hypothetical protein